MVFHAELLFYLFPPRPLTGIITNVDMSFDAPEAGVDWQRNVSLLTSALQPAKILYWRLSLALV